MEQGQRLPSLALEKLDDAPMVFLPYAQPGIFAVGDPSHRFRQEE